MSSSDWDICWPEEGISNDFVDRIRGVLIAGFELGPELMPHLKEWLEQSFRISDLVSVKKDDSAISFFCMPEAKLYGKNFLWGNGFCVLPSHQQRGLVGEGVKVALAHLGKDRPVGWYGGRTQSPHAIKLAARYGRLWPVDAAYTDGKGPEIVDFLRREIRQLEGLNNFDPATGIQTGAYPGSLIPSTVREEEQWPGLDLAGGDVLILACELNP